MLKTLFRFPEINLGFVTSAWGAGHLTPKKSLGRGAFDQRKGPHGGEFGGGGGGRAWAPLDLTHTLFLHLNILHTYIHVLSPPV